MKATKDNAIYIEKVIIQDDGDTDFEKVTDTTVNFIPNEISLLDTTTNTQLESEVELTENEEVLLIDNDNNITDTTLGSVTTGTIDTTQILDVFGDNSCVAAYPFDENANDLSGNYNGTWSGTEQYETGKYGQAAKFDGDSYIDLGNIFYPATEDFTISFWLNPNKNTDYSLVEQYSAGSASRTQFYAYNNGTKLQLWSASIGYLQFDNTITTMTDFNSIVLVRQGGAFTLYINNIASATIGDSNFEIEQSNTMINQSVKATILIDQVRIFNRALTEDEVQKLYCEQRTKYVADIYNANLSEAPVKAFKKQLPDISIACEATAEDITDTSFTELTPETTTYDGSKFTTVYSDLEKEGRAIQRKIIAPNVGIEIIEPFTSNLWKKDS